MFDSMKEWESIRKKTGKTLYELVVEEDCQKRGIYPETSVSYMKDIYEVMKQSVKRYDKEATSQSGLSGKDAQKLHEYNATGRGFCGDFINKAMEIAVSVAESNACMRQIVAAPTAGSCGVIPAVLIAAAETFGYDDDQVTEALFIAAKIGEIIATHATISGAEGGCQAEIGSASSMAAGALVYLFSGDAKQVYNASAMALKSLLGLACDPVAGLVEVPCVKRNVIGAVNAITAAQMSLAGVESRIPADEVIDAMMQIGHCMSDEIRETGNGGLAATPTGIKYRSRRA